jgi:hypothetical protein
LFVLVYRPPEIQRLQMPRVEALAHFTKIALRELSSAECVQIVRAKLAQWYPARAHDPPALAAFLAERTQGNPFYLEELLNLLHDRGVDPWGIEDPATLLAELPDSLHALVLSRIDQLSARQRRTLTIASVIGRVFRVAWLLGYYPNWAGQSRSRRIWSNCVLTHALDTRTELAYLFKHIVTHEVARNPVVCDAGAVARATGGPFERALTGLGAVTLTCWRSITGAAQIRPNSASISVRRATRPVRHLPTTPHWHITSASCRC